MCCYTSQLMINLYDLEVNRPGDTEAVPTRLNMLSRFERLRAGYKPPGEWLRTASDELESHSSHKSAPIRCN